MQSYEALILIEPDAEEERQDEIIARVREIVLGGGGSVGRARSVGSQEALLRDPEAHGGEPLDGAVLHASRTALAEVDRVLRITDGVLRHKTLRRKAASRRLDLTTSDPSPTFPRTDVREGDSLWPTSTAWCSSET